LTAAANFAVCFGDKARAERFRTVAGEVRDAFNAWMWSDKQSRFLRRIEPLDLHRSAGLIDVVMRGHDPYDGYDGLVGADIEHWYDEVIDSSLYGIYKFGMLDPQDERVAKTMNAVESELWVKTDIGGMARYADDYYHRVTDDIRNVPGNPWFICTLWLADWRIARARSQAELDEALPMLEWAASHTEKSGVLAEQVHPMTGAPLSVSPLTWSHATYVGVVMNYLEKLEQLQQAEHGEPDIYRMRRRGRTRVRDHLLIDRFKAVMLDEQSPDTEDGHTP
jgi:GH15 family glucan-1,4-alpha-glucosidase